MSANQTIRKLWFNSEQKIYVRNLTNLLNKSKFLTEVKVVKIPVKIIFLLTK